MNKLDKKKIMSNMDELCPLINLSIMIPMVREGIFSQQMMYEMMTLSSDGERKQRLLFDLCFKGKEDSFGKFIKILKEMGNSKAVEILMSTPKTPSSFDTQAIQFNFDGNVMTSCINVEKTKAEEHQLGQDTQSKDEIDDTVSVSQVRNSANWSWDQQSCRDNSYLMEKKPRGYCLIMNIVDFKGNLGKRDGSDVDANRLS